MGNGFMKIILRSPIHKILSGNTLIISFSGRMTGRLISTPVNFAREGNNLYITSTRSRHWWRNLRGGAPVEILLQSKKLEGWAEVIVKPDLVEKHLAAYFKILPQFARYFGVTLKPSGQPDPALLKKAAAERIGVLVKIKSSLSGLFIV